MNYLCLIASPIVVDRASIVEYRIRDIYVYDSKVLSASGRSVMDISGI
jgi:hypothetical protein